MPDKELGLPEKVQARFTHAIEEFRHRLSYIDALPQLTFLGLISGICAALLIVAFRLLIDTPLTFALSNSADDFESLSLFWRFALPAGGAIAIGCCLYFLDTTHLSVSVSHVLDRLHNHQGRLPIKNVLVQFFGGIASLLTGQSVGREGPAVHLGAGAASLLGQWLKLPNNSLRTLVGCGVAAAIAASFNTPIAGVIFAMEVVLMEYTITGFIPVILASVSGAAISQMVFADQGSFSIHSVEMNSLWELPFMALAGIIIAAFAWLFLYLQKTLNGVRHIHIVLRFAVIGIGTGTIALFVPEVMGLGYDTLEAAMGAEISAQLLLLIIFAKLLATGLSTGLGMPGGVIGPTLVIGGCIGGVLGFLGNGLFPDQASNAGFYVTLGMAAMMGAVLNAPLAALMAVVELTYNPNVIFPSMVVIVVACVVTQQVFRCESIFVAQLRAAGTLLKSEPDRQVLSRAGVRSVMSTDFVTSQRIIDEEKAKRLLATHPTWIVFEDEEADLQLLRAADLAKWLEAQKENETPTDADLNDIPGQRFKMIDINPRANLFEARVKMQKSSREVVYVERTSSGPTAKVMGIITSDIIDNFYRN